MTNSQKPNDSYSSLFHLLEQRKKSAATEAKKIPDESDCGDCSACKSCPNCGNCAQCASCTFSHACLCSQKQNTIEKDHQEEYLLVSIDDYAQLMDDLISLADIVDELCRMHMEKFTLSKQFRSLSSILSSKDEELYVQNAQKLNNIIDNRWGNAKLIPIEVQ